MLARQSLILLLLLLLLPVLSVAQGTLWISGYVTDEEDHEPLPLVSVLLKDTHKGTTTDEKGYFKIKLPGDTAAVLVFQYVGYETRTLKVGELMRRKERTVNIQLKAVNELDAIIVRPGENPAHPIIRKIIASKERNNPDNLPAQQSDVYTKSLVQLKNMTRSAVDSMAILKSLRQAVLPQDDTTGLYSLPLLFTEELKTTVRQRDPYVSYSIPGGKFSKGVPVLENTGFVDDYIHIFSRELNFYNDNLFLQNTPLVSPVSSLGWSYYDYRLVRDTVYNRENGLREYRIRFTPKNPRDAVFTGELTVYDSLFALKKIRVKLSPQSNVPYVIRYEAEQEYGLSEGLTPYVSRSRLDVDVHFWKFKDDGVHSALNVNITNHYYNVSLHPLVDPGLAGRPQYQLSGQEMGLLRSDSLLILEQQMTAALNSLNEVGWIKVMSKVMEVAGSGYIPLGAVDFGPYPGTFKRNGMEGFRINIPLRTSLTFHPNFFAEGFVGYGFSDGRFKGGLDLGWKFKGLKRRVLSLGGLYDSYRVGNRPEHVKMLKENALSTDEDLFLLTMFTKQPDKRYTMRYGAHVAYEHEWYKWLTGTFGYKHYTLETGDYTPFTHNGAPVPEFGQQELSLQLRVSSEDERQSDFYTRRTYMGNGNIPIIHLELIGGRYQLGGGGETGYYGKAHAAVRHFVNIGAMQLRYMLEMGLIMGAVPFPLLEGHRSSETWLYSPFKFDLLYDFALASDFYTSLLLEYNLNGLLFNRIPFVRDLNIKEMLTFKLLYGFQDRERHARVLDMPDYVYALNSDIPYMEVGVGVKNILQFFGLACVWRVPAGDVPYARGNFSVVGRFSFEL